MQRNDPVFQEYHYKRQRMGFMTMLNGKKSVDRQVRISAAYPKGGASWKKTFAVYDGITAVLVILSF